MRWRGDRTVRTTYVNHEGVTAMVKHLAEHRTAGRPPRYGAVYIVQSLVRERGDAAEAASPPRQRIRHVRGDDQSDHVGGNGAHKSHKGDRVGAVWGARRENEGGCGGIVGGGASSVSVK